MQHTTYAVPGRMLHELLAGHRPGPLPVRPAPHGTLIAETPTAGTGSTWR